MARPTFPRPLAVLIGIYLIAGMFAIAATLAGQGALSGIFLVVLAMPWTLSLNWVNALVGLDSVLFNLGFLAVAIGANAGLLYLLGRRIGRA